MRYYLLEVQNTGGGFTYGFITEKDQIKLVKEKIKSKELSIYNCSDDGFVNVNFFEFDQILHVYGPAIDGSSVTLNEYKNDTFNDVIQEYFYYDPLCYDSEEELIKNGLNLKDINTFSFSNPDLYKYEEKNGKLKKGTLIFGGFYTEKHVNFPIVIQLEDNEELNLKNVYIGTVNLDETVNSDEILRNAFYIREKDAQEILDLYYGNEVEGCIFSECISDILYFLDECANKEKIQPIFYKSECKILDIQGKGESEEIYVVVKDYKEKLIYEHSNYDID